MKVSSSSRITLFVVFIGNYVEHRREVASFASAIDITERLSSGNFLVGMPPGCICASPSSDPCQDYDCRCECDLNTAICDDNCCCDVDCDQDEKTRFSTQACSAATRQPRTATENLGRMCYDDPSLIKINPKYPLKLDDTIEVGTQKSTVRAIRIHRF